MGRINCVRATSELIPKNIDYIHMCYSNVLHPFKVAIVSKVFTDYLQHNHYIRCSKCQANFCQIHTISIYTERLKKHKFSITIVKGSSNIN